jgi:hypothetical protein
MSPVVLHHRSITPLSHILIKSLFYQLKLFGNFQPTNFSLYPDSILQNVSSLLCNYLAVGCCYANVDCSKLLTLISHLSSILFQHTYLFHSPLYHTQQMGSSRTTLEFTSSNQMAHSSVLTVITLLSTPNSLLQMNLRP